jgi:hypothetical protein
MAICFQLIIVRSSWLHNDLANADATTVTITVEREPEQLCALDLRTVQRTPHARGISALTAPEFEGVDSKVSGGALGSEDRMWQQSTMPRKDIVVTPTTHGDDIA